ncbi:unnamed protein product, partial [Arabidopsis halleri]
MITDGFDNQQKILKNVGDYFLSKGRAEEVELLDIFEVGLYGGIIFPLLKIFPIIALMLVTGLSTSPEVAQSMIFDFVGSSVFALTIQWGACIVFGTKGVFDIGCDQLVQQEEVRITNLLKILKLNPTKPRPGLLKRLFVCLIKSIRITMGSKMENSELNEFTLEFGKLGKLKGDMNAFTKIVVKELDKDDDGMVNEDEFTKGFTKWLKERKAGLVTCAAAAVAPHLKVEEQKKSVGYTLIIASIKVIAGILIVVFLAKPFKMNISLLSASAGIPSFYVALAVIPLARNLKNALSLHFCAKREKQEAASVTPRPSLPIILAIVYAKGLTWNCSTEVLIVVFFGLIVGLPASITST